ncbi:hypothetical protein [Psychroflexus salis]|uniref:Chain length determinant protein n=1 Tax=Psychroflexus salis TaxID=1526574 RepID=A0A917E4I0_9FLAO|nr:hypothetical protein [Psychroflexus salis]GGE02426.1 hypothetical protein GCM10010831_00240 [Psychroflexus salis]
MAENTPTQANEEIDLGVLFDKIKSLVKSVLKGIVNVVQFFWKHKFRLIIVGVIGIAVGLYLAKTAEKIYLNELLIEPNYKSTQYVYDKVNAINKKIESADTIYLQDVFGVNYKKVKGLEIEPVVDVYGLVSESEEIQETFKVLFVENGNTSFFEEDINKINYTQHKIRILVEGEDDNEIISSQFFDYINSNLFYQKQSDVIYKRIEEQLEENELMRKQIDSVIAYVQKKPNSQLTQQGISFSASQEVSELINRKRALFASDFDLLDRLAKEKNVVALVDKTTAIMDRSYNFSFRIIPVVFVLFYCLVFLTKHLVRKLSVYA